MKVKNIACILAAAAIGYSATSCSHDELDLYSGPTAMLYIQELSSFDIYGNPIGYRDHTDADFANVPPGLTMWSVSFEVKMAGEVEAYDRPYSLKVEADSTTAVEGVDYDLEDNEFMIKAGKASDVVKVRLHRTEKIKLKSSDAPRYGTAGASMTISAHILLRNSRSSMPCSAGLKTTGTLPAILRRAKCSMVVFPSARANSRNTFRRWPTKARPSVRSMAR